MKKRETTEEMVERRASELENSKKVARDLEASVFHPGDPLYLRQLTSEMYDRSVTETQRSWTPTRLTHSVQCVVIKSISKDEIEARYEDLGGVVSLVESLERDGYVVKVASTTPHFLDWA